MKRLMIALIPIMTLLLLACALKPTPTPAPTSATPNAIATTPSPPKPIAPQASPEEAAWSKVVEAAKKEATLTIYSYSWVGDAGILLSKAFKNRYGIELDIITGRGSEFVERLKTEKRMGHMTGDIIEGGPTHLILTKEANILAPSINLPALGEKGIWTLEPLSQDKDGYILSFMPLVGAPYINTKLVKAGEEPKSWPDILQPAWKGQIMVQDPAISSGAYRLWGYVQLGVLTEDFFRQLTKQDIRFTTGLQQEAQLLAQGQRSLSLYMIDSDAASLIKEGAPIKAVSMKEGVVAYPMVIGQVENSPHPNAARIFLNWLFTQEGQKTNAQARSAAR